MKRRYLGLLGALALLSWWRRRNAPVSLRQLANQEGINTWTAWRRSRLPARRDPGSRQL
jgi:aryl carrier-like protein